MKKVLLINGSPRAKGNTSIALAEVAKVLETEGIDTITVHIGNQPVRGCMACGACRKNKTYCAFSDALYDGLRAILDEGIDGLVVGSPVYYAGPNGSLCALLDRLFYSLGGKMAYKPAASVAVCRRGGASATFDRLNKYFTINNMPVVSSQYWNSVHGAAAGEAVEDLEGLQTMRTLGRNMAWMLRGLQQEALPVNEEPKLKTSFVR
jgi:multimeric flavodoxin WrbA